MAVYLNHLDAPYPRDSRTIGCQHYAGFVNVFTRGGHRRIMERNRYHSIGRGSRFLAAVSSRGIGWRVVRVWWDGDRKLERAIKNGRNLARYCPVCNPKHRRRLLRSERWRITPRPGLTLSE